MCSTQALRLIGVLDADLTLGPLELHLGPGCPTPGVLHLGFTDIRLTNLLIIIPAVWAFVGFGVITFTAGLTVGPDELLEAAKVDGATPGRRSATYSCPACAPSVVVVVVSVIFALRTFDIVYVMTGGGPAQDTEVLGLLLWQQAFQFLDSPEGRPGHGDRDPHVGRSRRRRLPFLRKNGACVGQVSMTAVGAPLALTLYRSPS